MKTTLAHTGSQDVTVTLKACKIECAVEDAESMHMAMVKKIGTSTKDELSVTRQMKYVPRCPIGEITKHIIFQYAQEYNRFCTGLKHNPIKGIQNKDKPVQQNNGAAPISLYQALAQTVNTEIKHFLTMIERASYRRL